MIPLHKLKVGYIVSISEELKKHMDRGKESVWLHHHLLLQLIVDGKLRLTEIKNDADTTAATNDWFYHVHFSDFEEAGMHIDSLINQLKNADGVIGIYNKPPDELPQP